jgi:formate dehydrogenase major subunit/formate dehydrogenase alpha subunit
MTNSIEDMKEAKAYLVIGSNTTEQHPIIGLNIRKAAREGAKLIVADPRRTDMANRADIYLPIEPGSDIALLNGLAHIILKEGLEDKEFIAARTEGFNEWRAVVEKYTPERVSQITGVPVEHLYAAARLYATTKPAALVYCMGITQHTTGHNNVQACANIQMLTGNMGIRGGGVNPLRGQNNVQGACDMGCLPDFFPGYQRVADEKAREKFALAWGATFGDKPGLTIVEMTNEASAGKVRALYVVGENPAMSDPDSQHVTHALEHLDFLVVQDIFLTETAKLADVVLPAASFAEKTGTFTNTERRVQMIRPAVEPPGEARPDWQIVAELARRTLKALGKAPAGPQAAWDYSSPAQITEEIAALTPAYGGIRHSRLEHGSLQWPCPTPDHAGTPILHVGKFSRGLGKFNVVEHAPPAETPDKKYPLILTTGRRLAHYHTGTMTRRVEGLNKLAPEERVEINVVDAKKLGVADGDWVLVESRRGKVKARAAVGERCKPGVVFMTFHFAEALANVLTNPALDPVAKIPELKVCAVRVEKAS